MFTVLSWFEEDNIVFAIKCVYSFPLSSYLALVRKHVLYSVIQKNVET